MRLKIAAFILMVAAAGVVQAADVASTLKALQDVGQKLKEFSADVRRTEIDDLGNNRIKSGHVFFQRTADGAARIHIVFDKRISRGQIQDGEKTEYLLEGRDVIDRNYRTKSEVKHEVLKPGQKLDQFKIGEGPFPLPIGQDPAEVQKAFDVALVAAGKNDPAKSTHLALTPKPGTPLAKKYKVIDIWVNDVSHLPMKVETVAKQGKIEGTELSNLVLNPPGGLKAADFKLPDIDSTWNRAIDNLQE